MPAANTDKFIKVASNTGWQLDASGISDASVTSFGLVSATSLPTDTAVILTIDRVDSSGNATPSKMERIVGVLSGTTVSSCVRGLEGTAQAHAAGAVVEIVISKSNINKLMEGILAEHNQDGTHKETALDSMITGTEAAGDIIYHNGTIWTRLPAGTDGQYLKQASGVPSWASLTSDGWNTVSDSWSYASATTITVPSGAASLYQVGDRVKFTQTTVKYFVIVAVADTLLTVTGGSDYTVANAAISAISVSHQATPVGFPQWFAYTPTGPTNCTLTGRFVVRGRTCRTIIRGAFTGGTTWSHPTLPITSSSNIMGVGTYFFIGTGGYLDTGTSNNPSTLVVQIADGYTTAKIFLNITDPTEVNATSPITWANGDVFEVVVEYEI